MLILTRKPGEQVQIGNQITVTIQRVDRQSVRIGIEAPAELPILRSELLTRVDGDGFAVEIG